MFTPPPLGDEPFHDAIRLADWVELNLLMEEEPVISATDVTAELAGIPPDDADDSERRFADDGADFSHERSRRGFWEPAEDQAESAFSELSRRAGWLKGQYPLELDGDAALLHQDMAAQETYRFLVILRARQLYPGALEDDGTLSGLLFEELVKHALGAYVGSTPEHRARFGLAGGHRGDGLPDRLPDAIAQLGGLLHEARGDVPSDAHGDFKVDAVAWKPFGDDRPGQLVILGQATISEGHWMSEEPAKRWIYRQPPEARLIQFLARPLTAVAFAETLSLTSADALRGFAGTFSSIPFDRLRLLSVLRDEDLPTDLRARMNAWSEEMSERLPR
ncbi:MAG: hypothetical protein F4Y94_03360 [Chloroflexi bacterium]|nr:hypothetical protein [Chloroflexota bacterium]